MRTFPIMAVALWASLGSASLLPATDAVLSDDALPSGVVSRLGVPVWSSHHQAVAIVFSPDDELLACAGLRTQVFRPPGARFPIEVFHSKLMDRVTILEGNESPIQTMQFAPSKAELASVGDDGTLLLWDIGTGECLWAAHQVNAKQVAFSADGNSVIATDCSSKVWILDRESGRTVREHDLSSPEPPAMAPMGMGAAPGEKRRVRISFSQEDGTMTIMEEGKPPVTVNLRAIGRSMNYWRRICLQPDGKRFVWLTDAGQFETREVETGEVVTDGLVETGVVIRRKFNAQDKTPSPVGLFWPASNNQSIQVRITDTASLIDVGTQRIEKTLFSWPPPASWLQGDYSLSAEVPEGRPRGAGEFKMAWGNDSLALSPDGTLAALMGRRDANRSEIRILNLRQETTIKTFALESRYRERELYRGHINSGEQIRSLKPVTGTFSHDARRLAVEMLGEVRLLDLDGGEEIRGENRVADGDPVLQEHEDKIAAVSFSPDGKLLATASFDSTVRLWEVSTGKELLRREHTWTSVSQHIVAFSPDGALLAAGLGDKVVVLRCPGGEPVCELGGNAAGDVIAVGFVADGKRLATWKDSPRKLTWWEMPSGRQLETVGVEILPEDKPAEGPTHTDRGSDQGFAFSPDMRRMAVTIYLDRVMLQCDPLTGKRLYQTASPGHLAAPCFSADSKRFVLGGDGEPFRIVDTESGEVLREIAPAGLHREELMGYRMNPYEDSRLGIGAGSGAERPRALLDGGRILATEDLGGTRFYDVESGKVISQLPEYGLRAVSPGGRLAATVIARFVTSASGDILTTASTVLVWDMKQLLEAAQPPAEEDLDLGRILPFN